MWKINQRNDSNRRVPKHREYSLFTTRKQSFYSSRISTGQSSELLAKAGFFYAGHKDYVRSYCCGILIKTWSPNQDPLEEHKQRSPNCSFLDESGYNQQRRINDTVEIDRLANDIRNIVIDMGYTIEDVDRAYKQCEETNCGLNSVDINQLTNRLIDIDITERPVTGENNSHDTEHVTEVERTTSYIYEIEREVHHLRETLNCKVCMDNPINTVLMPCAHLTSCTQCSNVLTHCPQCRAFIHSRIRVYT